jgi:hypothetical protein
VGLDCFPSGGYRRWSWPPKPWDAIDPNTDALLVTPTLVDIGPLPSLAEVALALWPRDTPDLDDPDAELQLMHAAQKAGLSPASVMALLDDDENEQGVAYLPTPSSVYDMSRMRRVPTTQRLRRVYRRLRRLHVEEEFRENELPVEWLTTHAPHGGSIQVTRKSIRTRARGAELSISGVRLSRSRAFTISREQGEPQRNYCTRWIAYVNAVVRVYRDTPEPDVEILGITRQEKSPDPPCDHCTVAPSAIDDRVYVRILPAVDRRRERTSDWTLDEVIWQKDTRLGVRAAVPQVRGAVSLWVNRHRRIVWTVRTEFAPGHLYAGYRRPEETDMLPMWAHQEATRQVKTRSGPAGSGSKP